MRRGLLLGFLTLVGASGAVFAASPAAAATPDSFPASHPAHYIVNYDSRLRTCGEERGLLEVEWNSYAEAQVGFGLQVQASSKKLCKLARRTAAGLPGDLPYDGGFTASKADMIGYALNVGQQGMNDDPIGRKHKSVPRGMRCYALPSQWATEAWTAARLSGVGSPNDEDFAGASGVAAGAGYCVNAKAKSNSAGEWLKTPFIAWIPDVSECTNHFKLHQDPDPNNPGQFLPPPSFADAQVFGSYDSVGC